MPLLRGLKLLDIVAQRLRHLVERRSELFDLVPRPDFEFEIEIALPDNLSPFVQKRDRPNDVVVYVAVCFETQHRDEQYAPHKGRERHPVDLRIEKACRTVGREIDVDTAEFQSGQDLKRHQHVLPLVFRAQTIIRNEKRTRRIRMFAETPPE